MSDSDSELDDFLATTLARQLAADEALYHGDPELRLALWSMHDPVTVLGAARSARLGGGAPALPLARSAVLQLHRIYSRRRR
ncbi:MAG TPA: hypothetical protein VE258_09125, partial [Ktedonobacterales bacterium]|nr:hypothetical protein [Ktedonobacterales bacterium]